MENNIETFEEIKDNCLVDCKNFLGLETDDALKVIEMYLNKAYQAGKNN